MKLIVGNFNQEKALEGGFSVMVKTDGSFAALVGGLSIFICIHLRSDKRPGKVNVRHQVVMHLLNSEERQII